MYKLTIKEESLLDNFYFNSSHLTFQEMQEALVELCEKHNYGLVESLGSQYTAFLITKQLPSYKGNSKAVQAIVEWNRNKGNPFLEMSWTQDTITAYLGSKRTGKDAYEKIMNKFIAGMLTKWQIVV